MADNGNNGDTASKAEQIATAEAALRAQMRRLQLAKAGLPLDGTVVGSQADVARHFKVNRSTVHDWVTRGMPGRPGQYILSQIESWREQEKADETDPLLAGGTDGSPNLEEYRKWRAKQAKAEYEKQAKLLVSRDLTRESLLLAAAIFSRCAEQLGRRFGPEAQEALQNAIGDFERLIRRQLHVDQ